MAPSITRILTAELRAMRALALDHRELAEAAEKRLVEECTKRGINMRTHAPRPRREAALDLNFEGLADIYAVLLECDRSKYHTGN